ncbi:Trk system potassium transporter TrkA [Haliangium sp.]|uniref:Trk system potassium transporter TrkA n=1 Tax=Haliangium sp. TaxID=2663208 RepID=UPI003D0F7268
MYIIIVGAGEVGSYLTRILIEENHDVAVIESDDKLVRALDASHDALIVHGTGVSQQSLRQAGINKADLVLAVTQVDEVNLIACMTAAKCGCARTVARVRQATYLAGDTALDASEIGLSLLVGPERAVAGEVVGLLSYQGSGEVHYLADNRVALLELPLSHDSPLTHEPLAELRDVFPNPSLVAAVQGPRGVRIPRGDDVLSADERATILTLPENAGEFWILSGKPWHLVRHVLIIGCGNIGFHLARELERKALFPTIIEADRERAEWVSRRLTKSIVLCGDGTDPDFLKEQLDERSDAVVVLLEDDEKAVLVGLFCKHLGAKKVIVRSDKPAYTHIAYRLGVDALISPKRAVADEILRFVRKGRVASAYMLGDHEGEILDFRVPVNPVHDIIDKPLREISFPEGALLGVVIHEGEVSIATGDTILHPGDDLLVACLAGVVPAVEELFR